MAVNWKFYPPHYELETATLTATTGTSSTLNNIKNQRPGLKMDVDTVGTYVGGADEFMYRIDFGAGVTKGCEFIALVNHNLYQEAAQLRLYVDTTDNSGLTGPITPVGAQAAVSTDEPIWLEEFTGEYTKRYFWPFFDSISAAAYCGVALIGSIVEPSVDPSWETPITIDIESGRIVNVSPTGFPWKTRTHGVKNAWNVKYQLLNDADYAILSNWLTDSERVDLPFVFTNDGGTTYYYGELVGDATITPVQAGLFNVEFQIQEVLTGS